MSIFARGGVEFRVNGKKIDNEEESLLKSHPVGMHIITDNYNFNPIIEFGGDWERIEAGRVLWTTTTDGEGGSLVEAGLPNISTNNPSTSISVWSTGGGAISGVFKTHGRAVGYSPASSGEYGAFYSLGFDASRDNDIYGNSNTVQPPAVKVYIWKRVG